MWRKCDLHRHTRPDTPGEFEFDPKNFLKDCVDDGLDVVAVTDHNRIDYIDEVVHEAVNHNIIVVPGIEISTDRGHILALAPGGDGGIVLNELCSRVPIMDSKETTFERLTEVLSEQRREMESPFRNHVVLIGAHVDAPGSLLGPKQTHSVSDQVSCAQNLQALEVLNKQNLTTWRKGIKQTDVVMALLRSSDAHPTVEHDNRSTWIYLPEITTECFRHAFATHEASISHSQSPPSEPELWIKTIQFDSGPYQDRRIDFSPRANALIGPPSSGKSLIIDAIRYVFDVPCPIEDVQSSIERRLERCLPDGTAVTVELRVGGNHRQIQRVRGGTDAPVVPAKPIVFSQVELARRSMEPTPSVALLDLHCPQSAVQKKKIQDISDKVRSAFKEVAELAREARGIRIEVENEQDGLEATRSAYTSLVGDDETAKLLGDLGRLEAWHEVSIQRLEAWRSKFQIPDEPELPSAPQMETALSVDDYVPTEAVDEAVEEYRLAVARSATNLVTTIRAQTAIRSPRVDSLREDIQTRLGGQQNVTPELADEAEQYRKRVSILEQKATELADLDDKIKVALDAIDALIDQASAAWRNLRQARRAACKTVNSSMPSFQVRLSQDSLTEDVDQLLFDLRTGTYLHESSLQEIRDSLDRKAFIRSAVRHLQYPTADETQEDPGEISLAARKIAQEAMAREKFDGISRLAALWPSDGIEILHKQAGGPPVAFDSLTEGLKALGIKELSFAASQLPVVTDQPEDAVPTTAIFENLVPTLRQQRVSRQFIIASHDANVVVSGDVERVIVLPAEASEQPVAGTLFDASIRASAIALLEGGDRAFELRRRRYGNHN